MKKISVLCIVTILLTFSLTGCLIFNRSDGKWNFDYEPSDIVKIQIVDMVGDNCFDYTVIKDIDASFYDTIYSEIQAISWGRYWGDLSCPIGTCIVITFNTGDYDIISYWAPSHIWIENNKHHYSSSFYRCDEEEFEALINKYLN
ncbi:MAG: hypothetical protein IKD35_05120 [Clostridia bacterium]|nr:hypothetical protein [Clostridia bacterium]